MKTEGIKGLKRNIAVPFMFIIFILVNSCSKSSTTPNTGNTGGISQTNTVTIQGLAFSPTTLTVPVNTTVTWTNKDATAHTVTSDTGAFDSGSINTSGTFSFKFTSAGTFNYHCTIHPFMTAKVVVQ